MAMNPITESRMRPADRVLLALDRSPWDVCYRALIGFGLTPLFLRTIGGHGDTWRLFLFLLVTLAAMRIVPGLVRRLIPVSDHVKVVWADRRMVARRYDSYQLRKLLGIGIGWALFLLIEPEVWWGAMWLALAGIAIGLLGLAFWLPHGRAIAAQGAPQSTPIHPISSR